MLLYFVQAMDADSSNADALPASALGTEGRREPGPLAMRTTDGQRTTDAVDRRSYADRWSYTWRVVRARDCPPFLAQMPAKPQRSKCQHPLLGRSTEACRSPLARLGEVQVGQRAFSHDRGHRRRVLSPVVRCASFLSSRRRAWMLSLLTVLAVSRRRFESCPGSNCDVGGGVDGGSSGGQESSSVSTSTNV